MDAVLENVLKLIRLAMNPSSPDRPDLSNWPEIIKELKMQAILPFVSEAALSCDLNENQKKEVIAALGGNIYHFHHYMAEQDQLIKLLEANHIPVAIMKGTAAAQYYPKPELRAMGDIDILVLPEDFEKAFHLLCESGYKNQQGLDHYDQHHVEFFTEKGLEIELHRYFSSSLNPDQNDLLNGWHFDVLRENNKINISGYDVPTFPALENGLILLAHMNHHLTDGLGLRQILDWMLFVQEELDDLFWENTFKEKAKAIGLEKLARISTRMCQKYLGLGKNITWCTDVNDILADELLIYIFNKGNFGCKGDYWAQKTSSISHRLTSPRNFFRYLTDIGMLNMQNAGLKPRKSIAWIYQIRHIICKIIKHKDEINLISQMKLGKDERVFLEKLGVTKL